MITSCLRLHRTENFSISRKNLSIKDIYFVNPLSASQLPTKNIECYLSLSSLFLYKSDFMHFTIGIIHAHQCGCLRASP